MPLKLNEERAFERDGLGVGVEYIGEGWHGDFDEAHPEEDEPLERFWFYNTAFEDQEDDPLGLCSDTCYCTSFPADAADEELQALLEYLWRKAHPHFARGESLKHVAQMLTWAGPDDVRLDRVPREVAQLWAVHGGAQLGGQASGEVGS